MSQDSTLEAGDRIRPDGKYEIANLLGEGRMGAVCKAFDHFLRRDVAIKTLLVLEDPAATKVRCERFRREASAVARVSKHPNIVQIYEIGIDRERPFIAMEFVDGDDVSRLKPNFTLDQILILADCVASGLDFIHSKGIFHRDVKPANVMTGKSGEVQLMDFGRAKDTQSAALTKSWVKLGSPLYMAPEALADRPTVSARSDQYALAVILYELITMRCPFEGTDLRVLCGAIQDGQPPRASEYAPWTPGETDEVLARCLAIDPEKRFASCQNLVAKFRRSLGDTALRQGLVTARREEAAHRWQTA